MSTATSAVIARQAAWARGWPEPGPQAPAIVPLDLKRLEDEGFLVPARARTLQADEFRRIRRQLAAQAPRHDSGDAMLILVTSALDGEGRTWTALNLALGAAADGGSGVLLVDADGARRGLTRRLGMDNRQGFLDLLDEPPARWFDCVCTTNVPDLAVVPAGIARDGTAERLASPLAASVLQGLRADSGRIVFVDAPPLLEGDAVRAFAARADRVVVVVKAGATPRVAVLDALGCLEEHPAVSVVLNGARRSADLHARARERR